MCKQANSLYVLVSHANESVARSLSNALDALGCANGYEYLPGFVPASANREYKFKTSDKSIKVWESVRTESNRTSDRLVLEAETDWETILAWFEGAKPKTVTVTCDLGGTVTVNKSEQTVTVDDFDWTFTAGDITNILSELNG